MQWTARKTGLLLLTLASVLVAVVVGEEFFHKRNREDNVHYRAMEDKNVVTSIEKAEVRDIIEVFMIIKLYSQTKRVFLNI